MSYHDHLVRYDPGTRSRRVYVFPNGHRVVVRDDAAGDFRFTVETSDPEIAESHPFFGIEGVGLVSGLSTNDVELMLATAENLPPRQYR